MKTSVAAALVSLGAVLASPARTPLPALPAGDGLYLGRVDSAGTFTWLFHESSSSSSSTVVVTELAAPAEKRDGAYCEGFAAGPVGDVNAAVAAITEGCHDTYFHSAIAFQRGGAVAYGCAYGGAGERCNGYGLGPVFSSIAAGCGPGNAGYYELDVDGYEARFGYTRAGNGFC
ncbi:mannose-6-phosphate isomerase, class I [Cordyceps fumosorosea ARSEF 2679]|uniref:Mannose-6-phosphate isomerase, class I n=1 Tax=Cordyceps fumosorosea (strain ARSEF 2679) TaxID=1081104 RepID=A0A167PMX8_CORFA|nr:mannose-6-phosphate isomerase, class I [Cordyceps fumosorosea ARSEF 2679]OAA56836.1 mannose-6-phosphate isomerase, class I [Cordyceps fumosorosea ARSEF 2679]